MDVWINPNGEGIEIVEDVQINGTSILVDGVANVPLATSDNAGVAKVTPNYGVTIYGGALMISHAMDTHLKSGSGSLAPYKPITPDQQHMSTFYGLAKAAGADMKDIALTTVGIYPEDQKSAISQMLNAPVQVSGTTPTIVAKAGIQYICGEVATLDITLPDSGIVDVVFTSGSTPTVLTVTPPTGQTIKWANGFDPTSLDTDTTYELNILNGLGVACSWT